MQSKLIPLIRRDSHSHVSDVLCDDVVFHSPVRDYHGRADVLHILSTIGGVLDEITAQRQIAAGRETITIISATHEGQHLSGVLDEIEDHNGRIETATLLLRPLPALRQAINAMAEALEQSPLPTERTIGREAVA